MGVEELAHCRQNQIEANVVASVPFILSSAPRSVGVDGISSVQVAAKIDPTFQPRKPSTASVSTVDPAPTQTECRRRTSLPLHLSDSQVKPSSSLEKRWWRSFDCASVGSSSCASSSSKSQSLRVLENRILETQQQCEQNQQKLGRKLLLKKIGAWFSWRKKEQVRLRQMAMIAEVAMRNRSLYILEDLKTLVLTMDVGDIVDDEELELLNQVKAAETDDERLSGESDQRSRLDSETTESDAERLRFLQGVENSERVLQEDVLHHLLGKQTKWLHKTIELREQHGRRRHLHALRRKNQDLHVFLNQFVARPSTSKAQSDQQQFAQSGRVPWSFDDEPTAELLCFERLIGKNKLLKPSLRNALDQLAHDVLNPMTGRPAANSALASLSQVHMRFSDIDSLRIFESREPRDVLRSLLREVTESIASEAQLEMTPEIHEVLRSFVEQMLFSRLACAAFLHNSTEMDELNAIWREQVIKIQSRNVSIEDMGLPAELCRRLADHHNHSNGKLFSKSISAFNKLPYLVPSSILAAFLAAIRLMYKEAHEFLGLSCGQMSADVILPLLVFILSRSSELGHLHTQVALLESFAIDASTEGSEAAYYLACLQAAMTYIMTRDE